MEPTMEHNVKTDLTKLRRVAQTASIAGPEKIEAVITMFISQSLDAILSNITRTYLRGRIKHDEYCVHVTKINRTYNILMDNVMSNIEIFGQDTITYACMYGICSEIVDTYAGGASSRILKRQISRLCALLKRNDIEIAFPTVSQDVLNSVGAMSIEERTALLESM